MLNGMFERIGVTPGRRDNNLAECTAQNSQAESPALEEVIEAIQCQW